MVLKKIKRDEYEKKIKEEMNIIRKENKRRDK